MNVGNIAIPSVIVTDRSVSNTKAIGTVFPSSCMRLCVWHVWENIVSYMGNVAKELRIWLLTMCHGMLSARSSAEHEAYYSHVVSKLEAHGLAGVHSKMRNLRTPDRCCMRVLSSLR